MRDRLMLRLITFSKDDYEERNGSIRNDLILGGCATSHYTGGRDFSSANVPSIVKGKTTASDLKSLFGDPFAESRVNETDEKWVYTYANGSARVQSYFVTMKVLPLASRRP
jgi:hypothetical protein